MRLYTNVGACMATYVSLGLYVKLHPHVPDLTLEIKIGVLLAEPANLTLKCQQLPNGGQAQGD
jgi:hypothetical protein